VNKAKSSKSTKSNVGGILVPVDFSPTSEEAVAFGADLADRLKERLMILHVVHDPGEAPGYYRVEGRTEMLLRLEDVAGEMFDAFLTNMKERIPNSPALKEADQLMVRGLPVTRILEVVGRVNPMMVVMGSAGRTGLSQVLLGSKAEHLVRLCPAPLTIVKRKGQK